MPQHAESQKQVIGGVPSNAELDALVMRLNEQADVDEIEGEPEDFKWAETQRKAASAIVALRQERDAARLKAGELLLKANYEASRREAEERDAALYRWLRSASVTNGAIDPDDDDFWNDLGDLLDEKFDAAIDAARKAKP